MTPEQTRSSGRPCGSIRRSDRAIPPVLPADGCGSRRASATRGIAMLPGWRSTSGCRIATDSPIAPSPVQELRPVAIGPIHRAPYRGVQSTASRSPDRSGAIRDRRNRRCRRTAALGFAVSAYDLVGHPGKIAFLLRPITSRSCGEYMWRLRAAATEDHAAVPSARSSAAAAPGRPGLWLRLAIGPAVLSRTGSSRPGC